MTSTRRILRVFRRAAYVLLALVAFAVLAGYVAMHASLPRLDGEARLAGLTAAATLERDALGVVTITARDRNDAMRALGYVHAQERFFEMDLMRRMPAGELAALFGRAALEGDRRLAAHALRDVARRAAAALAASERETMDAYVAGVNAGLADLGARPFTYLLLRQRPAAWLREDTFLVVLAMFVDLQDEENARELSLARLRASLPPSLYALLTVAGSGWDAPLIGAAVSLPALPTPAEIDLRRLPSAWFAATPVMSTDAAIPGSNSFAVAGSATAHGSALVANDMHLGLRVPNIWFRARLRYGAGADAVDVAGVTLAGVPGVAVGSNGHVAWAFTNSYGDWHDWVRVDCAPAAAGSGGSCDTPILDDDRSIAVAGDGEEMLRTRRTRWGPVLATGADARLALEWTAHHPDALNGRMLELAGARDIESAMQIANGAGIPAQNFVVGDRAGRIAWTIAGRIPRRAGFDPGAPAEFVEGRVGWLGWLTPEEYPRIVDPGDGRIWTANARVVDAAALAAIGDGGYDLGARAAQIRDGLRAKARVSEADLLAIQLDDRALFLARWNGLLAATADRADDAVLRELGAIARGWQGRADIASASYRLTRAFREYVHEAVLHALTAPARAVDPAVVLPRLPQAEAVVWALVAARPAHLLDPRYADWNALLEAAAHRVVDELGSQPGGLSARTWGERNTSSIRHPLSRALPLFARNLDMPARALPGDANMPRVQAPDFGASQRMVVSPGHEADGIMHMPGGQSGHPLSPFYGAGQRDWEDGRPTPFLPGETRHRLILRPQ